MNSNPESGSGSVAVLLPIMAAVFLAYLVAGAALPVIPLHVHDGLGLGAFMVGLVAGAQFAAALVSRVWSGRHADLHGGRHAVIVGLLAGIGAGALYLLSLAFVDAPDVSVVVLLLARALHGGAQSFVVGGALIWSLARMGPQHTGKVLSWVGIAIYAATAVGAPMGTTLYAEFGFAAIAAGTGLVALATLPLVMAIGGDTVTPSDAKASFLRVAGAVWFPGTGLALSAVGYGAITTFVVLLFAERSWEMAWLAYTVLAIAFMSGRIFFGGLPDRMGGARVALVSVLVEAAGLALIWLAPSSAVALIGVALTGLGYSLVYPGLGVEAVRRAPPQGRGLAMGAYTAFFDLSLGIANPVLGLIAGMAGQGAVFLASALLVFCAAGVAWRLYRAAGQPVG